MMFMGSYDMEVSGCMCLFPEAWLEARKMGLKWIKIYDSDSYRYELIPHNLIEDVQKELHEMRVEVMDDVIITDNNMLLLPDKVNGAVKLSGNRNRIELFLQEEDRQAYEEMKKLMLLLDE